MLTQEIKKRSQEDTKTHYQDVPFDSQQTKKENKRNTLDPATSKANASWA